MKTSEIDTASHAESRRRDPLAVMAFWISVIIIMPEADLVAIAALQHRHALAVLIVGVCFAIVFTPLFMALRRIRQEPSKWSGMGYLRATGAILVVSLVIMMRFLIQ